MVPENPWSHRPAVAPMAMATASDNAARYTIRAMIHGRNLLEPSWSSGRSRGRLNIQAHTFSERLAILASPSSR